jgi:hypothetical protein
MAQVRNLAGPWHRAVGATADVDQSFAEGSVSGERDLLLKAVTTDGTTTQVTRDGAPANAGNIIRIPENSIVSVDYVLTAIQRNNTIVSPAWAPSTAYAVADLVVNGGRRYVCTVAGTSAASGGPTGTSITTDVADGTASWRFMGFPPGLMYKFNGVYRMLSTRKGQQVTPLSVTLLSRDMSTSGAGARAWGMSAYVNSTWDAVSLNVRGEVGKTIDWLVRADVFQVRAG